MTSFHDLLRLFLSTRRRGRVATLGDFVDFLHGRSAYIAQSTLYGYLKTRMGLGFPEFFQDERFSGQIADARLEVFAACLGDLTVFGVSLAGAEGRLDDAACARAAEHCFEAALDAALEPADLFKLSGATAGFAQRVQGVSWAAAHLGEAAFSTSPEALSNAAPVSDEYRRLDRGIVTNSLRFHWREIREDLRRRMDKAAVALALEEIGRPAGDGGDRA